MKVEERKMKVLVVGSIGRLLHVISNRACYW